MERINIEEQNILFKNIISGPAPLGRMLNYIKLAGRGVLKHINGNRDIHLIDNVGSAWAIEFMIGLGIVTLGRKADRGNYLDLTENGRRVYEVIKDVGTNFDETMNINKIRDNIEKICPEVLTVFEEVFRTSIVYQVLYNYLKEYGYEYNRNEFIEEYWFNVKKMYDDPEAKEWSKDVRSTTVTTAGNRVPSLLQLCQVLNYLIDSDKKLLFIKEQFNKKSIIDKISITYSNEDLKNAVNEENNIITEVEELEKKYGIDGTVLIDAIVRNSTVQRMFRSNLIAENGCKCMICGIENKELLVASHIKPASESDVYDKIDNNNGLLLCANHDKLFDRYLITFDCFSGKIKISDKLSEEDKKILGIDKDIELDKKIMNEKRKEFLAIHNIEFHNKSGGNS